MQHEVKENYDLRAWKGTPGEMADLFERAYQLVTEVDPGSGKYRYSVNINFKGGQVSVDDPAEFREYGNSGRFINKSDVTAHVSSDNRNVAVMITLRGKEPLFSGASVSVSGVKHAAVSGVARQLNQELDRGKRHRPRVIPVFAAGALAAIGLSFLAGSTEGSKASILAGLAYLVWALTGSCFFTLPIVVPALEILDPDDPRTRYERWRTRLLASAGALFLVVIGALLSAIFQS